jgi:hypothetical protein
MAGSILRHDALPAFLRSKTHLPSRYSAGIPILGTKNLLFGTSRDGRSVKKRSYGGSGDERLNPSRNSVPECETSWPRPIPANSCFSAGFRILDAGHDTRDSKARPATLLSTVCLLYHAKREDASRNLKSNRLLDSVNLPALMSRIVGQGIMWFVDVGAGERRRLRKLAQRRLSGQLAAERRENAAHGASRGVGVRRRSPEGAKENVAHLWQHFAPFHFQLVRTPPVDQT